MADDLKGKLETELELKSTPDQFFNFWKVQVHQAPDHTPANVQGVKVHEGDWETSGSIKIWDYTIDGKPGVFKERIEIDEENKIVKLIGLDGDVFKIYKVYNGIWHATPKGEGSLAKLTLEYEKLNETAPAPHIYMDFMISMTKDIDAGLVQA
ncbi:hypothetical protein P3X46_026569 [Hevea brasiliensis]|uniref:Bet v I/Major latex protein domain-containing protein n=1 Tax=Hevea brasiliensis TaxID=3981 RepID=A0ABQ9L097_HEVBR|nr:MLP-like protein 328 [Hevea brasiliensis]KAJ9153085.1 hypothetical protein P3X46_026569 [Hevea brasiliensis]